MIQTTGFTGFSSGFTQSDLAQADPATRFTQISTAIVSTITIFAGLAFIFWFIIGAITWITGGHDPAQIDKGKRQISTAIIGLIATAMVLPIAWLVSQLTGIDIINPENVFNSLIPQ